MSFMKKSIAAAAFAALVGGLAVTSDVMAKEEKKPPQGQSKPSGAPPAPPAAPAPGPASGGPGPVPAPPSAPPPPPRR